METGNSVTFDGSGGTGGRGRRLESRRRFAEGFVGAVVTGGMTMLRPPCRCAIQSYDGQSSVLYQIIACKAVVPPSHSDSRPVIIAVSALLELVEWIESRRKSCQGGVPCNAVPTPLSPPVSAQGEPIASGPAGPSLVQSVRAESPPRDPNPAPTPAPKTSRRRRAGGRSCRRRRAGGRS